MTIRSPAVLLLLALGACAPGESPHPSSPANGLSITGAVTGVATSGVTVSASGPALAFATTDANGRFALTGLPRGLYQVTARATGNVSFSPSELLVSLLDRDVSGQDFTAHTVNSVHGTISGPCGAAVPVSLIGPVTWVRGTDAGGFYRADALPDGTYAVAPSLAGQVFTPVSGQVTVSGGSVATLDFVCSVTTSATHAISGTVAGPAAAGLTITLSGANSGTTSTGPTGEYAFPGLADGAYRVAATPRDGYLLRQRDEAVTVAGSDVAGVDFTSYLPPTSRFLYEVGFVNGATTGIIRQYAIDPTGALSTLTPAAVPTDSPYGGIAVSPSSRWAYATNPGANTVAQFTVGADGQLAPMSTATAPSCGSPVRAWVDPRERWLWVYCQSGLAVWRYDIQPDGSLVVGGAPAISLGAGADDLAASASGKALYLVSGGAIQQYQVDPAGAVTPMAAATAPLPADRTGWSVTALTLDPSGRYAYAAAQKAAPAPGTAVVIPFAADAAGALAPIDSGAYALPPDLIHLGPSAVVAEPSGQYVYAGYDHGMWGYCAVSVYATAPGGALVHLGEASRPLGGPCGTRLMLADPAGRFLWVASPPASSFTPSWPAQLSWLAVGQVGVGDGDFLPTADAWLYGLALVAR
jgi:6-phosphogluconolactonase (cycloisomerase 2 family)